MLLAPQGLPLLGESLAPLLLVVLALDVLQLARDPLHLVLTLVDLRLVHVELASHGLHRLGAVTQPLVGVRVRVRVRARVRIRDGVRVRVRVWVWVWGRGRGRVRVRVRVRVRARARVRVRVRVTCWKTESCSATSGPG